MAFSFFGSSPSYYDFEDPYRRPEAEPRPLKITLADLVAPRTRPRYPEPPKPIDSFDNLGPDAKKGLRREAILNIARALGGDPGRIGSGLAVAAQEVGDWKEQQLATAQARQEHYYAGQLRQADLAAEQEKQAQEDEARKVKATGALKAVQEIADAEPEWQDRAEAAAMSGQFDELDKMLGKVGERKWIRSQGGDPDDPLWKTRAEEKIKSDVDLAEEKRLKEEGLGRYWKEPTDLGDIEARSRAAARGQHSIWGDRPDGPDKPKIYEFGDMPYAVTPEGAKLIPGVPKTDRWTTIRPPRGESYRVSDDGRVRPIPPGPDQAINAKQDQVGRLLTPDERKVLRQQWASSSTLMVLPETQTYVEQQLGRPLSSKEKQEVEQKWKAGTRPGLIVQQMKGPKPPDKKAPTEGQAGTPKRKVSQRDRDEKELRAAIDKQWPGLPPPEREAKFRSALARAIAVGLIQSRSTSGGESLS